MKNSFITLIIALCFIANGNCQDLLQILQKEQKDSVNYVDATFKSTRITYGHSVETRKKGIMEVFMATRYWDRPTLTSQSFAADKVSARFAIEYAITDRLTTGIGGGTWDGRFDAFVKYRLVRQETAVHNLPFSITLFQNADYYSRGIPNPAIEDDLTDRLSFTTQALIASKISRNLSLQLAPTFIHKGLQFSDLDPENHLALGFGGRYKMGRHVSFVSEYYAVFNPLKSRDTYGPFALGVNWEIGDVLMQFMLTNTPFFVEDAFIVDNRYNFNFRNPNLNFGFNFTYIIHWKKGLGQ